MDILYICLGKTYNAFTINKEKPVIFSTDENPDDETCWNFLKDVIPGNVAHNKILQKLFIG